MKIKFIAVGKTDAEYLKQTISVYENRLKHYVPFEIIYLSDVKNQGKLSEQQLKIKEGEAILDITKGEELILLDEKGKQYSSVEFSDFLLHKTNLGLKCITFVVGGAYGFSEQVYSKASSLLSLSKMTFTHQMIRLLFVEQLYRAFTIIRGESYHHE